MTSNAQIGFRTYLSTIQQVDNLESEAEDFQKPRTQVMAVLLNVENRVIDAFLHKMERKMIPDW